MAPIDFNKLLEPVPGDEPCGPDLDLLGDAEFAQFVARIESMLPASFLTRDENGNLQPFDRSSIDFPAEFKQLGRLLDATRDLRLLTISARLSALNRDLAGLSASLSVVAALIRDFWAEVPPRGDDGDFGLRSAILQALDDNPTIIQPLQYIPLVETRRSGPITYRSVLIATGEAKAREGEQSLDRTAVDRALAEAELSDLKATSAQLHEMLNAVSVIQSTWTDNLGSDQGFAFEKLPPLVVKLAEFVDAGVTARDPSPVPLTTVSEGAPPPATGAALSTTATRAGAVTDIATAREALSAVLAYFQRREPSNPAIMLVEQAQRLMGKSFPEVVKLLLPAQAEQAKIQIGADKMFGLTFEQFAGPRPATTDLTEGQDTLDSVNGANGTAGSVHIVAETRLDAASLLDQVSAYYRAAEPSSPIPLFTERARSMIERDFLTILKEVLPALAPKT